MDAGTYGSGERGPRYASAARSGSRARRSPRTRTSAHVCCRLPPFVGEHRHGSEHKRRRVRRLPRMNFAHDYSEHRRAPTGVGFGSSLHWPRSSRRPAREADRSPTLSFDSQSGSISSRRTRRRREFPGRSQLTDCVGPAWGQQLSEGDRSFALLEAQALADEQRLNFARAWFPEVPKEAVTPIGTSGRRWLEEGVELRLAEEFIYEYEDPTPLGIVCFFIDAAGFIRFLRQPYAVGMRLLSRGARTTMRDRAVRLEERRD